MFFSRVRIAPGHLGRYFQYNHYQLHQLLWKLFKDKPEKQREFLFRQTIDEQGKSVFYLVSKQPPVSTDNALIVETKPYQFHMQAGELLSFSLRANPVAQIKEVRSEEEQRQHAEQRKTRGLKEKTTKKRVHHDVVMHLKNSLAKDEINGYSQAELEQIAGEKWLSQKAEKHGFKVLSVVAQSYEQHHFKKRQIKLSTLDFDGVLQITDPDKFRQTLFNGLGRAKAFGCGLLMVKRI